MRTTEAPTRHISRGEDRRRRGGGTARPLLWVTARRRKRNDALVVVERARELRALGRGVERDGARDLVVGPVALEERGERELLPPDNAHVVENDSGVWRVKGVGGEPARK